MTNAQVRWASRGAAVLGFAVLILAACSDNKKSTQVNMGSALPEDQFSTAFGTDFRAPADSEPVDPKDNDVIALNETAEPIDVQ